MCQLQADAMRRVSVGPEGASDHGEHACSTDRPQNRLFVSEVAQNGAPECSDPESLIRTEPIRLDRLGRRIATQFFGRRGGFRPPRNPAPVAHAARSPDDWTLLHVCCPTGTRR